MREGLGFVHVELLRALRRRHACFVGAVLRLADLNGVSTLAPTRTRARANGTLAPNVRRPTMDERSLADRQWSSSAANVPQQDTFWSYKACKAVVLQSAARAKAACRRVQRQRERLDAILADEEARWRGRVSGRQTDSAAADEEESVGWELQSVVELSPRTALTKAGLSNASTRCASPFKLDPIASMSSLEDVADSKPLAAAGQSTPKLLS